MIQGLWIAPADRRNWPMEDRTSPFVLCFEPVFDRLQPLHWYASNYDSGPFDFFEASQARREEDLDALFVDIPNERRNVQVGAALLRSGFLPDLAAFLYQDWIELVGIGGSVDHARAVADDFLALHWQGRAEDGYALIEQHGKSASSVLTDAPGRCTRETRKPSRGWPDASRISEAFASSAGHCGSGISSLEGCEKRPEALLDKACLVDADLRGADLRGSSLKHADLSGADLEEADWEGADLTDSILLSGTNLRRCNLRNAKLEAADIYIDDILDAANPPIPLLVLWYGQLRRRFLGGPAKK